VTSRRKKKIKEGCKNKKKRISRGERVHPLDEIITPAGGVLRSCSKYNLRKGAAWGKNS
jgi:hypothetical protein